MTQYEEERQHCKEIADTLEAYANGDMWRDEEGEEVNLNDLTEEEREAVMEQGEELSLYDCFDEVFDIEYRVGSDGAYYCLRLLLNDNLDRKDIITFCTMVFSAFGNPR